MSQVKHKKSVSNVTNVSSEEKEIKREQIFSRYDKPFYIEQHIVTATWMTVVHVFTIYCCYLNLTGVIPWSVILFEIAYSTIGKLGTTIGCHRYWTHKTFKAKLPLQILLMLMQTISIQYPIHKWCLDHRIHHKYTDTNADPHNSKRGFWFSHIGWLLQPKHKDLQQKLKTFDMSDLETDPVVRFQSRWWWSLATLLSLGHVWICMNVWGMSLLAGFASGFRRAFINYHVTFSVNSFAHMYGYKPYDRNISASENILVSLFAVGEGWHNYHHTFPWDYKTSELGWKVNLSTMVIDFFAAIGWAYDLKTVSQKMLKDRLRRTGDGSYLHEEKYEPILDEKSDFAYNTPADISKLMESVEHPIWGWDDENLSTDMRNITKILRPA